MIYIANEMTGFYMKCNTGLKWVNVKQNSCFLYIYNNQNQLFLCLFNCSFHQVAYFVFLFPKPLFDMDMNTHATQLKKTFGLCFENFSKFEMKPQMFLHFT